LAGIIHSSRQSYRPAVRIAGDTGAVSHQQLFLSQPRSHRGFVYRIWGVRKQHRYVIFNDDGDRLIVSEHFSQVVEANQVCHRHINWVERMAKANRQRHPEPT